MIFVTVGTQKFPFDRLLHYIDQLIEKEIIQEEVFAQTGFSSYQPIHYSFQRFLDSSDFKLKMINSNLVITHGGTGSIMNAIKAKKKVIAVARKKEFGEHIDNHQEEIIHQLTDKKLILGVRHLEDLDGVIASYQIIEIVPYTSNTKELIESIESFLFQVMKERKGEKGGKPGE